MKQIELKAEIYSNGEIGVKCPKCKKELKIVGWAYALKCDSCSSYFDLVKIIVNKQEIEIPKVKPKRKS